MACHANKGIFPLVKLFLFRDITKNVDGQLHMASFIKDGGGLHYGPGRGTGRWTSLSTGSILIVCNNSGAFSTRSTHKRIHSVFASLVPTGLKTNGSSSGIINNDRICVQSAEGIHGRSTKAKNRQDATGIPQIPGAWRRRTSHAQYVFLSVTAENPGCG